MVVVVVVAVAMLVVSQLGTEPNQKEGDVGPN